MCRGVPVLAVRHGADGGHAGGAGDSAGHAHLEAQHRAQDLVSQVLTFDYLGALAVSLAFPLLLVPQLGLIRTGLLFGLMNAAVALWAVWLFRGELRRLRAHAVACVLVLGALLAGFVGADHITTLAEDKFYQDRIVFSTASPYQRIVVTQGKAGHRLFLNGNLQFAERDEYRYHEALVHPPWRRTGAKRRGVLGGGDGMAVREILKYPSVESVTLVELDPAMTQAFTANPMLARLNGAAAAKPQAAHRQHRRLPVAAAGAGHFRCDRGGLPRSHQFLHRQALHQQLLCAAGQAPGRQRLRGGANHFAPGGAPELLDGGHHHRIGGPDGGPTTRMCPALVNGALCWPAAAPGACRCAAEGLQFLSPQTLPLLFDFPLDMARVPAEVQRLSNQVLVHTYEREWGRVVAH